MTRSRQLALVVIPLVLASGCGIFKTEEQQRLERSRERPLEVPPDLTRPGADERFAVPDPRSATSYSQYNRDRASQPAGTPAQASDAVLPAVKHAHLERAGDQVWIVADATPDQVWPVVRAFWLDQGFTLARETPESGILETNWKELRPNVETSGLRGMVSRALPGMYSTGERDRFRTRLERGAKPGTTEIYVSHRGLEEVFTNVDQDATRWQPRGTGTDRDLEAEMLGRLLVKLGEPGRKSEMVTSNKAGPLAASTEAAAKVAPPGATLAAGNAGPLVVNDGFDRAWRRVGLALDRTGFTVEDRDRSKGVFFVRYIDPDAPAPDSGGGILDKLAFWRPSPKAPKPLYRVLVTEVSGGGHSNVVVQNEKGEAENSATGRRILSLLFEQLR